MNQGQNPKQPNAAKVVSLLRSGMRMQQIGRLREAEEQVRRALALSPGNPRALHLLGLINQQTGRLAAAEGLFLDAIAGDDREAGYQVSLGVLLTRTGRQREAVGHFEKALALAPGDRQAQYQLAMTLYRLGDLDDALKAFEKARLLNPDNAGLLVNMGSVLNALGRTGEAIELYRRAIRIDPTQAAAYGNLGNALAVGERHQEAIAAFHHCLKLQPDNPTVHANLGSCYVQLGDWASARSAYRQCLARNPGDITTLAMQAAVHNELGEREACAEVLDYEHLLDAQAIGPPDRYRSLDAFNKELGRCVLSHPSLEYEPGSHTTCLGQQTGSLLIGGEEAFSVLEGIIRDRIESYLRRYKRADAGGWRRPLPRHWRLDMWATVLHQGGHQMPHIHPSGWLSGVYYVACPFQASDPDRQGWIEFGQPPANFPFTRPARTMLVEPHEGLLVLFPSYFYHRTIPFEHDSPRISIAFDMVPTRGPVGFGHEGL